ncbi:MAG: SRPBCC family protein [Myxococcaceae bacterium]|nr:SRPBCC family protein [Myxococcaceae bacterium]
MAGATRSITINAPRETVFKVVSDYERYPEFLPEVKAIRTFNRQGNQVDVQYTAEIVKTIKYTLRLSEDKPAKLSWAFIEGEFMKDNKGGWQLEDLGNGQTKATYSIEVTLGALVPKTIVNALVDTQLPKMLESFKRRAESLK